MNDRIVARSSLLTYLRTASYFKKEQLFYWIWYGFRRLAPFLSARLSKNQTGSWRVEDRNKTQSWKPLKPVVPFLSSFGFHASDILNGRFRFLNDAADFGKNPDWAAKGKTRLWRYNLHYFSYLMAEGGFPEQAARHLIENWITENPPGTRDAWDPFPTSLRLVNWIKYLSTTPSVPAWADHAALSACRQALWLENCIEYHLLGNHLFKNAKALIFAGLFFCGRNADKWLANGLKILKNEMNEQVLSDGGHFERSPMYHSMILEDCLDLLNVFFGVTGSSSLTPPAGELEGRRQRPELNDIAFHLENIATKMAAFIEGMVHPDRRIPLFNDAALGIENEPDSILSYYEAVTGRKTENADRKLRTFPESGYFILAPRPGNRLIADCGEIGPDYQPGHAHCDLLSFELSVQGRRVIVDSGCARYEEGEIRRYNRGSAGHNTISVDGHNQSEVWGAHRCARRARPLYARLKELDDGTIVFEGAHDGYRRLLGSPVHQRSIRWTGDEIQIRDSVDGMGTHSIESRIHINPDLTVLPKKNAVLISDGDKNLIEIFLCGSGKIESTQGWYCPEFGIQKRCTVLRVFESHAKLPYSSCWTLRLMNSLVIPLTAGRKGQ